MSEQHTPEPVGRIVVTTSNRYRKGTINVTHYCDVSTQFKDHETIVSDTLLYPESVITDITRQLDELLAALPKWIDPNDKTQAQYLPWIGEPVLFCHDGVTYYGKHTGGSFQSGHGATARQFVTWECLWMYLPKAISSVKGGAA